MMWFAVCWSALQPQAGLLDRPHLHISALKRPTPVRSLLSLTQAYRGRSDPGQYLDGETMYSRSLLVDGCHSADHIPAIQWPPSHLAGRPTGGPFSPRQRGAQTSVQATSLPWWWCGGGGDLGPWHGRPEPDCLNDLKERWIEWKARDKKVQSYSKWLKNRSVKFIICMYRVFV